MEKKHVLLGRNATVHEKTEVEFDAELFSGPSDVQKLKYPLVYYRWLKATAPNVCASLCMYVRMSVAPLLYGGIFNLQACLGRSLRCSAVLFLSFTIFKFRDQQG